MRTKRICFVRHREYEPKVRREAEALVAEGYATDVICLAEAGHPFIEMDGGVRVIRLPLRRERAGAVRYILDYGLFFVAVALTLAVLDARHHYDAVQVSTMPDFLAFAAFVPRARGSTLIVFMHEPSPELSELTLGSDRAFRALEWIEQAVLRYADVVFTVTEQLKQRYVARGADGSKIHVVLNGPDPKTIVARDPSSKTDGVFALLCHGTIEERYGHEDLLEAVRIARHDIPSLLLVITGSGSHAPRIADRIDEMGLSETVRYAGYVDFDELRMLIATADLGIVAMRDTAYANLVHTNKMFDFIIASTPVLATRLDAVEAYFPPDAIAYAEPDDPKSMAQVIVELYRDPIRRADLARRATELYQRYGWPEQRRIYVNAIAAAVKP